MFGIGFIKGLVFRGMNFFKVLVRVCVRVCVSASRVDVVHLALATCKPSTEISLFSLDGLQNRKGRGGENVVGGLLGEVLRRCVCVCVCVM